MLWISWPSLILFSASLLTCLSICSRRSSSSAWSLSLHESSYPAHAQLSGAVGLCLGEVVVAFRTDSLAEVDGKTSYSLSDWLLSFPQSINDLPVCMDLETRSQSPSKLNTPPTDD